MTSTASVLSDAVFLGDSTTNSLRFWGVLEGGRDTAAVWTGPDSTLSMWGLADKEIGLTVGMKRVYGDRLQKANVRRIGQTDVLSLIDLSALIKPAKMIITLGINGCALMSKEDFKAEYTDLISALKEATPKTRIYLSSIFPVARHSRIKKASLDLANRWIKEIASEQSVSFIDTNRHLCDADGYAPSELVDSADGIHWNQAGCRRIVTVFEKLLEENERE
ncbi:MAG: hypothetical protein IJW71_02800 [Clostridia bacterium]|nr:hypothetical protein [Clostridia bacterium]